MDYNTSVLSCLKCGNIVAGNFTIPSPPVPNLLRTAGRAPSQVEADVIRNTIGKTEHDILLLDEEIDQLQAVLVELQRKHDALAMHLQAHRNLLAPVRKLPMEVMSEIFILCLPDKQHDSNGYALSHAVLLPGQICRLWREAALSTPSMWSSIVIPILPRLRPGSLTMAITWLRRSGGHPLSLRINGIETYNNDINPLLEFIVASSFRLKAINFDPNLFRYQGLRDLQNLPILEELIFQRPGVRVVDVFQSAPRLRAVRFDYDCPVTLTKFKLPWSQLSRVSLCSGPTAAFLEI